QALQVLFNKIFELFHDLGKVNATLPPLVKALFLQILVPPPPIMLRSQLFQNISIKLSAKQNVTARDFQVIINSAYGESTRFDNPKSSSISVLRTFQNPSSSSSNKRNHQNNL
ncbi:hypothetical protein VP01_4877g1, partial [Puccinia sorghi]